MLIEESLERGQNMQPRERDGRTNSQAPREPVRRFAYRLFGLIRLIDRTAGMLVESLARIGRRQASVERSRSRAPDMLFELCDRLRDRWLTQLQPAGRAENEPASTTVTNVSIAVMRSMPCLSSQLLNQKAESTEHRHVLSRCRRDRPAPTRQSFVIRPVQADTSEPAASPTHPKSTSLTDPAAISPAREMTT